MEVQTKSCQKEHWKTHKPICRLTVHNNMRAESIGVGDRKNSLQAWPYKNIHKVALAGVTALGLHNNRERTGARELYFPPTKLLTQWITETNVFMIYLDYVEKTSTNASQKPKMVHSLRDATCMPLAKVHELYACRFAGGSATLERDLAPRPRVLRIVIIDDGLPMPIDMFSNPVNIGEDLSGFQYLGSNWLNLLKRNLESGKEGFIL